MSVRGNTVTLPQIERLRDDFGIDQLAVGDRGMISQKSIATQEQDGIGWITALKSRSAP